MRDKETGHKILVQLSKWESKHGRQDTAAKSIFAVQPLDRRNGTGWQGTHETPRP